MTSGHLGLLCDLHHGQRSLQVALRDVRHEDRLQVKGRVPCLHRLPQRCSDQRDLALQGRSVLLCLLPHVHGR